MAEARSGKSEGDSKGGWKSAIFIICVEAAERFGYYGVAGNLVTYLTTVMGEPIAVAAKTVNTWVGVSSLFPIIGGFVADSYLGRFTTILVSTSIYLTGLIVLTLSVSTVPTSIRRAVFFAALYTMSVGEGGHKPCVQTFAADQFEEGTDLQRKAKSSFFNWWYMGIVVGSTAAILVVIYVEDYVSWTVGFSIPTVAVAAALIVFCVGIPRYNRARPTGSPFTKVAQVLVAAFRNRRLVVSCDATHPRTTDQYRCLDKAAWKQEYEVGKSGRWHLCPQKQVEEVKQVVRLIPIWLCCFMFFVATAQLSTFFTKQGNTMDRSIGSKFKTPAASFQVFTGVTIILFVPIYDRIIVPLARATTSQPKGIAVLHRMALGMLLITLTMAVCAMMEVKRLGVAKEHGTVDMPKQILPMKIWWLLPQYVLIGLSDSLMVVGMQELFYDEMPEEMRSVGAAAYISTIGVGNFLSSALISIVQAATSGRGMWLIDNLNRAHLDGFYGLLACLNAFNLGVFLWVSKGFLYKKPELDDESSLLGEEGANRGVLNV